MKTQVEQMVDYWERLGVISVHAFYDRDYGYLIAADTTDKTISMCYEDCVSKLALYNYHKIVDELKSRDYLYEDEYYTRSL